jgi:hypothetical protein
VVTLGVVAEGRVGVGHRATVVGGLQQGGHPVRLVAEDLSGRRLHDDKVLASVGKHVPILLPPALVPTLMGDGGERGLLLVCHAVLGQQFAQFLHADATLAGLNAADLRAVTFQDPGGVLQAVAEALSVPA